MTKFAWARQRGAQVAVAVSVACFAGAAFGETAAVRAPQAADIAANLALDQALAELDACPNTVLDLTQDGANTLGVLLFSPCHANERVVMDHAGIVVQSTLSAGGDLYLSVPILDPHAPVSVTFEDGSMAEIALAAPPQDATSLSDVQDVSARW